MLRFLAACLILLIVACIDRGVAEEGDGLKTAALKNTVCVANSTLPSMDSGGLIFFLHIPKTGGTTIRRNLEQVEGINYVFAKDYATYSDTVEMVEDMVVNGSANQSVLFYEIHAKTAPSFFKLRRRLKRWRQTALHHGVPVFFFSLVREPISYSFSHFDFFHLQKRNPTFERCNATEEDFLRKSVYNPQCQFLFKGESSMRGQRRDAMDPDSQELMVQPEDCEDVKEQLFDLMDWVGTTELLSTETIPLLSKLLERPNIRWENHRVSKNEKGYVSFGRENVSSLATEIISGMSRLDAMLYEEVESRSQYREIIEQLG